MFDKIIDSLEIAVFSTNQDKFLIILGQMAIPNSNLPQIKFTLLSSHQQKLIFQNKVLKYQDKKYLNEFYYFEQLMNLNGAMLFFENGKISKYKNQLNQLRMRTIIINIHLSLGSPSVNKVLRQDNKKQNQIAIGSLNPGCFSHILRYQHFIEGITLFLMDAKTRQAY
ncbi:unnamed protein product [Paramecium octaurelia]|uniref:Uncharacterized protein n=1 Tax=Paramecium octaurelia TaxID=43137 RepID=A0A8S1WVI4_PAROT|nr:unnamed protein product [Paramecium octaurelia]